MRKGIAAPIIIILFGLITVAVMGLSGLLSSHRRGETVRGVSISPAEQPGFSVAVASTGTWDLYEYLCTEDDACLESAASGKRYTTVSGAPTAGHEVVLTYSKDWENFDYIKLFVKSGWGVTAVDYNVNVLDSVASEAVTVLKDSSDDLEMLIIPVSAIDDNYVGEVALFSDSN